MKFIESIFNKWSFFVTQLYFFYTELPKHFLKLMTFHDFLPIKRGDSSQNHDEPARNDLWAYLSSTPTPRY